MAETIIFYEQGAHNLGKFPFLKKVELFFQDLIPSVFQRNREPLFLHKKENHFAL